MFRIEAFRFTTRLLRWKTNMRREVKYTSLPTARLSTSGQASLTKPFPEIDAVRMLISGFRWAEHDNQRSRATRNPEGEAHGQIRRGII
jgi:hypothetical protein